MHFGTKKLFEKHPQLHRQSKNRKQAAALIIIF